MNATGTVEFSEAMNETATTISVNGTAGTMSWNGDVLTFTPSSLVYNRHYTVTVLGKDIAGNIINTSWTFNTTEVGAITGILVDEDGNLLTNAAVSH